MALRKSEASDYIEGAKLSAFIIALISAIPMLLLVLVMIGIRISYDQPKGIEFWYNWSFILIVPYIFLALAILHFKFTKSVVFRWIIFLTSFLMTMLMLGSGVYGLITDRSDFIIYIIFTIFGGSASLCLALIFISKRRIDDILNK